MKAQVYLDQQARRWRWLVFNARDRVVCHGCSTALHLAQDQVEEYGFPLGWVATSAILDSYESDLVELGLVSC